MRDSDIEFLFVGDAAYGDESKLRQTILDEICERGLIQRCHFISKTSTISSIYNACDLTILTSFHEGTPNVVLESMACATPVIVTDISDNSNFIENGKSGYLVSSGDDEKMSKFIIKLYNNRIQLKELGSAARRTVSKRFSIAVMAKRVETVYMQLLASTGK